MTNTHQTGEFFQDELYQPNFEGLNGTWRGYFSGGRYSYETPPVVFETTYPKQFPVDLFTSVGPVPPFFGDEVSTVSDGGTTTLLLFLTIGSLFLVRKILK